ncbi:hypothetical protein KXD40_002604 [Peronospora effusa]|uniref:SAM-dependent MTase RsmB/NOP-type domain-containing protein n=1 Tax=Peronospora effusa TaxID=542832 RepID=A0A3M6VP46_9STRA|nr:hypothetical protein DD238_003210 [Peronospora effusa]RQM09226.1 hypothetical protein DD237_000316 [Peronospora effusa]UIZ26570.1 hypothetical protein KXD40_002604 [Peronospora effusa]
MTYSMCSLNPIENESVVAELLRRADGALELVDSFGMPSGLITRSDAMSWDVVGKLILLRVNSSSIAVVRSIRECVRFPTGLIASAV